MPYLLPLMEDVMVDLHDIWRHNKHLLDISNVTQIFRHNEFWLEYHRQVKEIITKCIRGSLRDFVSFLVIVGVANNSKQIQKRTCMSLWTVYYSNSSFVVAI